MLFVAALALFVYETATPMIIARIMAMIVPIINHIYKGYEGNPFDMEVMFTENLIFKTEMGRKVLCSRLLLNTLMFFHHIFFFNSLALRLKTPAWF